MELVVGLVVVVGVIAASWFVPYLGYVVAAVAIPGGIYFYVDASRKAVHDNPYGGLVLLISGALVIAGIVSAALAYGGSRARAERRRQEIAELERAR